MDEHAKTVGDALSLVVVGATLLKWLPAIAALFTIIWTAIRIYESRTVQNLIGGKEERDPYDDPL
jgi:hypothetical protein